MTLTSQTARCREDTRLPDPSAEIVPTGCCGFEQLVACHQPQVARLAYRLLGWRQRDAVDDVVQEVFLVALQRLPSFRGESSVGTWLTGITINQCRANRRRSLVQLRWLRQMWTQAPDRHGTGAAGAAEEETSGQVREAVAQLPPRDREVIVLFYLEQLPVAQIAQLLGAKPNAVEVRLHRARRRLKAHLAGLISD